MAVITENKINCNTIRFSADTSVLTKLLCKTSKDMTIMKDAVPCSTAATRIGPDASAKQAMGTNVAVTAPDDSVKIVTDSIQEQTKTVTD